MKMCRNDARIDVALVREMLSYDASTGIFTWRVGVMCGRRAGSMNDKGYVILKFRGVSIGQHRVAFLFGHGRWPRGDIDHVNGDPADNRLVNLRECSRRENKQNIGVVSNNTTGFPGVARKGRKFSAQIGVGGRLHHLGSFPTPEAAYLAYRQAKARLHSFAPHGRNLPAIAPQPARGEAA